MTRSGRGRRRCRRGGRRCRFAAGVHPHQAHLSLRRTRTRRPAVAARLDQSPLVRAIGEIGLDYHYDFSPRDVQQAVFRAQLALARRPGPAGGHPHARGRGRHASSSSRRRRPRAARGRVPLLHWRRGRAARALATGFYLSFSGILTLPQGRRTERGRARGATRPTADRNRRPVSGARAASGQAQRAGLSWRSRPRPWRGSAVVPPWPTCWRSWPATTTGCFGDRPQTDDRTSTKRRCRALTPARALWSNCQV